MQRVADKLDVMRIPQRAWNRRSPSRVQRACSIQRQPSSKRSNGPSKFDERAQRSKPLPSAVYFS
jgi:hypothetical protein